MAVLTRRLQVLVEERRYEQLERAARQRGVSVATLVREALELAVPRVDPERAAAAARFLEAEPLPLSGEWEDWKRDIEYMYEPPLKE